MEENEFIEEDEIAGEEEGQNRTFIILVAALGGLLAMGICAFAVWAVVIAPRMNGSIEVQNQAIYATNTAVAIAAAETATVAAQPTATDTPAPTDTPLPTLTRTPTRSPAAATVQPASGTISPTSETGAELTATRWPTATPASSGTSVPDTGIGALGAGVLAAGLVILLAVVRRIRRVA